MALVTQISMSLLVITWVVSRREENYQRASHFLVNPRLLERRVGCKAPASSSINRKITLADRAVPNLMIAFAMTHKSAAMRRQDAFKVAVIATNHQAAIGIILS